MARASSQAGNSPWPPRQSTRALPGALGFTRARISQLMDLILLAPDIQQEILFLECLPGQQPLSERALRAFTRMASSKEQRAAWVALQSGL